jgi:RNA polymerase-binding transcription factor DksA
MISKKPTTGKSRNATTARAAPSPAKPDSKKGPAKPVKPVKSGLRPAGREKPVAVAVGQKQRPAGNAAKERPSAAKGQKTAPSAKERAPTSGDKQKAAPPSAKERAAAPAKQNATAPAGRVRPGAVGSKKLPAAAPAASGRKGRGAKEVLAAETPDAMAAVVSKLAPDSNGYVVVNGRRLRIMSQSAKPIPVRRPRTRGNAAAAAEPDVDASEPVRTKLNKRELDRYRTLLLGERTQLVGDLAAMENQALRSSGGNLSHMPIHMADLGTDTFDQDFMLGLAENERRRLREIDEALQRIHNGTYGVCVMTGKPIPKARLDAKPWARDTIEAAREVERGLAE